MHIFSCPSCNVPAFFSNTTCPCGTALVFDERIQAFVSDAAPCTNRDLIGCNWRALGNGGNLCQSCTMTEVIPDTFRGENLTLWAKAEHAKRWVIATLGRWGWFTESDPGQRPRFHLLSEETASGPAIVTMGHANGLVTINLFEADPVEMVKRREALSERLRTIILHFRHEIAHFLFERLADADPAYTGDFRTLFGDERANYSAALDRYYASGPVPTWNDVHITPYASAHPHEDWAETAAHVMHLTDMLDSAVAGGLMRAPVTNPAYDAYAERDTNALIDSAVAYGIALNHVNRSMGMDDIYPFIHSSAVRAKLAAAHGWLSGAQRVQ